MGQGVGAVCCGEYEDHDGGLWFGMVCFFGVKVVKCSCVLKFVFVFEKMVCL